MARCTRQQVPHAVYRKIQHMVAVRMVEPRDSDYVRAWRKRMGWSLRKASKKLGVGQTTFQNYERGRRAGSEKDAGVPLLLKLACLALEHLPVKVFKDMGL